MVAVASVLRGASGRAVLLNTTRGSLRTTTALVRALSSQPAPVRHDWTREEVGEIYRMPFLDLLFRAAEVHRQSFDSREVQRCRLLSVKTGGCTEDCKYCAQSTRYKTTVKATPLMPVMDEARGRVAGLRVADFGGAGLRVGLRVARLARAGLQVGLRVAAV